MKKLYFHPTAKSSIRGWAPFLAEIRDEDDKVYFTLEGGLKSGFKIRVFNGQDQGEMVCFEEVKKTLFLVKSARLFAMNRSEINPDCVIHFIRHRWGKNKGIMELFLEEGVREYSNDQFALIHRDFWSKLEIHTDGSKENIYLAAWWCFHYWFRKTRQG
jgi:hypothetical protein